MKTLYEHNRERISAAYGGRGLAGVLCPNCTSEMEYTDEVQQLTSPPSRRVECPTCRFSGSKIEG